LECLSSSSTSFITFRYMGEVYIICGMLKCDSCESSFSANNLFSPNGNGILWAVLRDPFVSVARKNQHFSCYKSSNISPGKSSKPTKTSSLLLRPYMNHSSKLLGTCWNTCTIIWQPQHHHHRHLTLPFPFPLRLLDTSDKIAFSIQ